MKVVTILGSPRKNGNTAAILGRLEQAIAAEHEVERINVVDYHVGGCRSCYACQRVPDRPGCVQKDDGAALLDRLVAADVVVLASPVYGWSFPAQLKALCDREFCLVKQLGGGCYHSLVAGKRAILIATCAGDAEGNADLMRTMFERQSCYLGCEVVGAYVFGGCYDPAEVAARAAGAVAEMVAAIAGLPVEARQPSC
ncbi:MAG: flavodoxin family protein [Anaerolineae bacterium]